MKIEVYANVNNEERMIPYFMRHYTQFAHVILLENNSTDRTVEIAKSMGAEVWVYDMPDELNDQIFIDIKNQCWKKSDADWIMIVDADEFIYHPNIVKILETTNSTVFLPHMFNMFSEYFPTTTGQIYEEVTGGVDGGSKMNIFKRSEITDINYTVGCHSANPQGNVKLNVNSEIITLHMRNLSFEYVIERNARMSRRMSALNRQMKWGWHVDISPEEIKKHMVEEMCRLIKVV